MIYETDFQKQIENAFLTYGASVAQERAIPDVRDMLKIGLRQGLYAQFTNKLTHKDKMQKAQKSVAAAMNQSYVHGDVAMYDTFIRAARPWSYRYPIEDVQGSFGNPSSPDSHAAARYVEMRAGEIADYFFAGLKKNAIGKQWYSNYDDTEMIPSVFPSVGYWNIVNGCSGIAVAMATSVPQFNLCEVNEALIKIIQNPDISFNEIYCAPDFATGGTITNAKAVKESLKNGKGESIRLKAKLEYFPDQNMIQATELPYGVFTNTIIDQLAALTNENESYGIERVVDHTKKTADVRIYLSKGANPKKMIAKLYKDTSLENWYAINMILLNNGRFPKVFGWREACDAYITHIRECERNIIQFDLDKALARKNILDGLVRACSIIDEVVSTIRASASPSEASAKLIAQYSFNEEQTKAILAMKLSTLTKLDIVKLEDEAAQKVQEIERYQYLLNEPTALDEELIKILQKVADTFGDERRTKILDEIEQVDEEIKEKDLTIYYSPRGIINFKEKEKDTTQIIYTTNLSSLIIFTNKGKYYYCPLQKIKDETVDLTTLLQFEPSEKILQITDTTSFNSYRYVVSVSATGNIKKTAVSEYQSRNKKGCASSKEEDILDVYFSSNDNDLIMGCNADHYVLFPLSTISSTGRLTKGVKVINNIVGSTIIKQNIAYKGILVATTNGYGKLVPISDCPMVGRGLKGNLLTGAKEDNIKFICAIPEEKSEIFLQKKKKIVSIATDSIKVLNRQGIGTKIFEGDIII